jgi:amino acid efflux transporter
VAGLVVIALYAAGLVNTTQLIGLPTTLFLVVYLGCTVSAARTLRGWTRAAAVGSALAVLVMLAFCGWLLVVAGAVAVAAAVGQASCSFWSPAHSVWKVPSESTRR